MVSIKERFRRIKKRFRPAPPRARAPTKPSPVKVISKPKKAVRPPETFLDIKKEREEARKPKQSLPPSLITPPVSGRGTARPSPVKVISKPKKAVRPTETFIDILKEREEARKPKQSLPPAEKREGIVIIRASEKEEAGKLVSKLISTSERERQEREFQIGRIRERERMLAGREAELAVVRERVKAAPSEAFFVSGKTELSRKEALKSITVAQEKIDVAQSELAGTRKLIMGAGRVRARRVKTDDIEGLSLEISPKVPDIVLSPRSFTEVTVTGREAAVAEARRQLKEATATERFGIATATLFSGRGPEIISAGLGRKKTVRGVLTESLADIVAMQRPLGVGESAVRVVKSPVGQALASVPIGAGIGAGLEVAGATAIGARIGAAPAGRALVGLGKAGVAAGLGFSAIGVSVGAATKFQERDIAGGLVDIGFFGGTVAGGFAGFKAGRAAVRPSTRLIGLEAGAERITMAGGVRRQAIRADAEFDAIFQRSAKILGKEFKSEFVKPVSVTARGIAGRRFFDITGRTRVGTGKEAEEFLGIAKARVKPVAGIKVREVSRDADFLRASQVSIQKIGIRGRARAIKDTGEDVFKFSRRFQEAETQKINKEILLSQKADVFRAKAGKGEVARARARFVQTDRGRARAGTLDQVLQRQGERVLSLTRGVARTGKIKPSKDAFIDKDVAVAFSGGAAAGRAVLAGRAPTRAPPRAGRQVSEQIQKFQSDTAKAFSAAERRAGVSQGLRSIARVSAKRAKRARTRVGFAAGLDITRAIGIREKDIMKASRAGIARELVRTKKVKAAPRIKAPDISLISQKRFQRQVSDTSFRIPLTPTTRPPRRADVKAPGIIDPLLPDFIPDTLLARGLLPFGGRVRFGGKARKPKTRVRAFINPILSVEEFLL